MSVSVSSRAACDRAAGRSSALLMRSSRLFRPMSALGGVAVMPGPRRLRAGQSGCMSSCRASRKLFYWVPYFKLHALVASAT